MSLEKGHRRGIATPPPKGTKDLSVLPTIRYWSTALIELVFVLILSQITIRFYPECSPYEHYQVGSLKDMSHDFNRSTLDVKALLGHGTTGAVYRCTDIDGQCYAIKVASRGPHAQDLSKEFSNYLNLSDLQGREILRCLGYYGCAQFDIILLGDVGEGIQQISALSRDER